MNKRLMTSIALYGGIEESDTQSWLNFYRASKALVVRLGFPVTHLGVSGGPFHSGKVMSETRMCKKVTAALESGTSIWHLSFYSLPKDFKFAARDYDVYISRTTKGGPARIVMTFDATVFSSLSSDDAIAEFSKFIRLVRYEVYEMLDTEVPSLYATKMNPPESYDSLRIIEVSEFPKS